MPWNCLISTIPDKLPVCDVMVFWSGTTRRRRRQRREEKDGERNFKADVRRLRPSSNNGLLCYRSRATYITESTYIRMVTINWNDNNWFRRNSLFPLSHPYFPSCSPSPFRPPSISSLFFFSIYHSLVWLVYSLSYLSFLLILDK